jgi:hypothetical protein
MNLVRARRAVAALGLTLCGLAWPSEAPAQSITLSPAVVPLGGRLGQSARHTLTLANTTSMALSFQLEAQDVVVRGGRRVFVRAGEMPQSIAATAVFSARRLDVPPGQSRPVDVTLTLPPAAAHRAVVVLFRGVTRIAAGDKGAATVSLGTLFTFSLSDAVAVAASDVAVRPQSASSNLGFEQTFVNSGSEPVVLKGVTAIVNGSGVLVGKVPAAPRRLLPGERAFLRADYAGELPSGRYRAVTTYEFEGRSGTRSAEFTVR